MGNGCVVDPSLLQEEPPLEYWIMNIPPPRIISSRYLSFVPAVFDVFLSQQQTSLEEGRFYHPSA